MIAAAIGASAGFDPVIAQKQAKFAPPGHRLAHIFQDFANGAASILAAHCLFTPLKIDKPFPSTLLGSITVTYTMFAIVFFSYFLQNFLNKYYEDKTEKTNKR